VSPSQEVPLTYTPSLTAGNLGGAPASCRSPSPTPGPLTSTSNISRSASISVPTQVPITRTLKLLALSLKAPHDLTPASLSGLILGTLFPSPTCSAALNHTSVPPLPQKMPFLLPTFPLPWVSVIRSQLKATFSEDFGCPEISLFFSITVPCSFLQSTFHKF